MYSKLIYVENKSRGLSGAAWIGRGFFTRTRQTVYFNGKVFQRTKGYKYNHFDVETGDLYWISGVKKDGTDRLYNERVEIIMDENVVEEYLETTGLSALPKNKFVLEKLNNIPAKSVSEELFHAPAREDVSLLTDIPENELTDEQLSILADYYEEIRRETHKSYRQQYVQALKRLEKEQEKRLNNSKYEIN
ncbi:MAG: hypothetical protein MUC87_11110 [Bacteroidia bacterium]|jgi:hypothetical protein|nr:hypothetical protein [Bacteroidia bacterium]